MAGQGKKSSGNRKHGRDKIKCKIYRDHQTREKNKLKRILQSCGLEFARKWAHTYQVETLLDKLLKGKENGRVRTATHQPAG